MVSKDNEAYWNTNASALSSSVLPQPPYRPCEFSPRHAERCQPGGLGLLPPGGTVDEAKRRQAFAQFSKQRHGGRMVLRAPVGGGSAGVADEKRQAGLQEEDRQRQVPGKALGPELDTHPHDAPGCQSTVTLALGAAVR